MTTTHENIQREDDRLITEDVARAIEERELVAYMQPQFDVSDERMSAIETLVRWTQPDGNVVAANLFVPSLERTNTILGLDWYMVEETASFAQRHQNDALGLPVSVNLSSWHIHEPDFINILTSAVDWHNVSHERFGIEVSERVLTQDDEAAAWVGSMREAGFMVAIDDFGSAGASIELLSKVPASAVKIGRGLVSRNFGSREGRILLATLADLAHKLDMLAIAQGIETADELEFMREAGFDAVQGYHYAKPMSEKDLMEFAKA